MEQRLKTIVDAAPEQPRTFWTQAKKVCLSAPGIGVITFFIIFFLLLALQPLYIFKKTQDGRSRKHINFVLVAGIAAIGAGLVVLIAWLVSKKG